MIKPIAYILERGFSVTAYLVLGFAVFYMCWWIANYINLKYHNGKKDN